MPSITRDTPALSADQHQLNEISRNVVERCPDMREMARNAASDILRKHGLGHLEPDAVYWHRFGRTESSPRTFNGWEHLDSPIESLTLPQLVMRRFNANDQDNVDSLQAMSGFYSAGPDARAFNESNEVRLLPQDVLAEFWPLDFKTRFDDRMTAFWREGAEDFRTLAKANFIAKAVEDRQSHALNQAQFNALMTAIGIDLKQPITLAMLQSPTVANAGVRFARLDIAGYPASDILRIVEDSGRQFLYVPGEVDAFHVFDTPDDLQWWLMTHTNEVDNRARFMSHFALSTHAETDHQVGLHHAIDLMFSHWGPGTPSVINQGNQWITGDPFTHLRDATKTRMQADAEFALHDNSELRKQMWMGYLKAFGKTFGALAALDWPIALAAVGAGLADVGLNIDQAIHGHTTAERKSGVLGAIFGSIDVLFNGLFVAQGLAPELPEIPEVEEPITLPDPAAGTEIPMTELTTPNPATPIEETNPLAPFETNELLDSYAPPARAGRMQGIYVSQTGQTLISLDDIAYQVRYVSEMNSWVIIDPENPFSFSRNVPVRLDGTGRWQILTSQGLRGGGAALGKLSGRSSTAASAGSATVMPYDMPEGLRENLRARVESPSNRPFDGDYSPLEEDDAIYAFLDMRRRLKADVDTFYANLQLPERPPMPAMPPQTSAKAALRKLYQDAQGLVIGENHSSVASKQFLIDNMEQLAKQQVKTLYLEHLMTDLHQADLDLFARTGNMPETLQSYLEELDWGHFTDSTGRYTFINLVRSAHKHRIRIRAIDCMVSYRTAGLPDPNRTVRLKMMNYFANTVIRADQAASGGGRWIALVGNAHVNTMKGVAGVAELEGVIGLRIKDVDPGEAVGFDIDPGEDVVTAMGKPAGTVKADFRLRMAVTGRRTDSIRADMSLESRLPKPGNFAIQRTGSSPELIHRSRDGSLIRTPIKAQGGEVYIKRAQWPTISGRRFKNIEELAKALQLMGLRQLI